MKLPMFLLVTCALVALYSNSLGQTSAFIYQGSLKEGANPANGAYDLQFRLWDISNPIAGPLTLEDVQVTNGIFSVNLDFGTSALPGADRYLEIAVRPGISTGGFTLLAPKQQIASSPYSIQTIRAQIADNATALGGVAANQFVQTTDPRLSDARPPTAGSTNYIQNSTIAQASSNFNISGDGTAGGTLNGNTINAGTQFNIGGSPVLKSGSFNLFVGRNAGFATTVDGGNTFVGNPAGTSNQTGILNSFFGSGSGEFSSGSTNAFLGYRSGQFNSDGSGNTYIGGNAGVFNQANNSTLLGTSTSVATAVINGSAVGAHASVTQSNSLILGSINGVNGATSDTNVGIGTTAPSQKLHVVGNGLFTGNLAVNGTLNAALPAGSANYIQNSTTPQTASNFNISGTGTANILNAATQFNLNGSGVMRAGLDSLYLGVGAGDQIPPVAANEGANTIIGTFAGSMNFVPGTVSRDNVFVGWQTGRSVSGSGNAFFGYQAGRKGNGSPVPQTLVTLLGSYSNAASDLTNATAVGAGAFVAQSNSLVLGSDGTNVGIGTTAPNFRLHVRANGQDGIKIQHTGTGGFPQIRWTDSNDVFKASIGVDTSGPGSINMFVNGADRMILKSNGVVQVPGPLFINNPNTVVITSPNGSCWGITVSNTGVLSTFPVTPCP